MDHSHTLDDEPPSEGVYSVVAALENRSPLALPPLAEAVDPDALDKFLLADGGEGVTFEYCGYEVTTTPGAVRVRNGADGDPDSGDLEGRGDDANGGDR